VSHICALMVLLSTDILRVANSTPIVDLDSMLRNISAIQLSKVPEFISGEATQQVGLPLSKLERNH